MMNRSRRRCGRASRSRTARDRFVFPDRTEQRGQHESSLRRLLLACVGPRLRRHSWVYIRPRQENGSSSAHTEERGRPMGLDDMLKEQISSRMPELKDKLVNEFSELSHDDLQGAN